MNFQFFVLLNAILLIRPEELYPEIEGFRFYMITIWACMLTTQNAIINQFTQKDLSRQPITVCVFGMFFAVTISLLCRNMIPFAVEVAPELFKVVLYYLLLIGVLNTPERFRMFLGWIVLFVIILTTYALLEFHGYIDIPSIQPIMQKMYDKEAGCEIWVPRLVSSGIYNDPNDMCLILTTGMVCCLARSTTASNIFMRVVWLLPIIMFAYAMKLTQSRGGMLGIIVALATLICFRLGPKKGTILAICLVPLFLAAVGGRQAEFSMDASDTSQERMRLWVYGFKALFSNPFYFTTGIGFCQFIEEFGLMAHNSFVQAYVETGIIGGTMFLSLFVLATSGMIRLGRYPEYKNQEPNFRKLRPFVTAMVLGYAAGAYSVSRNFVVPTYLIIGLATAYIRLVLPEPPTEYQFNKRLVKRLMVIGVVGLLSLKFFTQYMVKWH